MKTIKKKMKKIYKLTIAKITKEKVKKAQNKMVQIWQAKINQPILCIE